MSYGVLDSFLKSYKEKLKLSAFSTRQANNLLFKKLIKHLSGNNQLIKVFCQCISKEIDEKYPINENFKQQFKEFESNVKHLNEIRKDFEQKKESLIQEIENYCESEYNSEKESKINYDLLLDNIQQICKKYIASHIVNDVSKDMKSMMCQFYLEKMELLSNSKIRRYQYDDLLKSEEKSLWKSIEILDNESGARLFPKNPKEIKKKFEDNKEKFKQSESVSEIIEYCMECNPYTAFQNLRNKVQFPLSGGLSHKFDELAPTIKEYKELKITDSDLKIKPLEDFHSQFFAHLFFQSLSNKIDFNPTIIWHSLETKRALQIKFDKNNDLEVYFGLNKSFVIPKKYLQEIDQELLKEIRRSDYPFPKCEYHSDNDMVQLTFSKDDASPLMVEVSLAEILEYNMQLKINSSIAKEFNELLAIAEDSSQDSYQLKIHVRHNNKLSEEKEYTAYEIKLEIHDCRKSHDQNEPIILSQQSTGFQWAFNFMFGFLYNVGSNFSFNKNIIYVMDEPATPLSVPARKEFRRFLKEYAHKNHVTFVLATHDPFLVDMDHLDEIRIVEKETESSVIKNHFNYPLNNASKDSDALDKIKRSLGVGQHVFHNPKTPNHLCRRHHRLLLFERF